jgi:hypothetical protein
MRNEKDDKSANYHILRTLGTMLEAIGRVLYIPGFLL